jgi:hypothetical protein
MHKPMPAWLKQRLVYQTPKQTSKQQYPDLDFIEYPNEVCEDCEQTVDNPPRTVSYTKRESVWRVRCQNCKCYQDPFTGKFEKPDQKTNDHFAKYKSQVRKELAYSKSDK